MGILSGGLPRVQYSPNTTRMKLFPEKLQVPLPEGTLDRLAHRLPPGETLASLWRGIVLRWLARMEKKRQ